jgi:hypothetical protein
MKRQGTEFDEAIAEFAMAYADQAERDWRALLLVDAIKADRISVSTPGSFLGSVIGASGPGGFVSGSADATPSRDVPFSTTAGWVGYGARLAGPESLPFKGGTGSSNPYPSSGES